MELSLSLHLYMPPKSTTWLSRICILWLLGPCYIIPAQRGLGFHSEREREEVIDSLITNSTSLTIKDVTFYLSLQESLSWTESGEEVTDVGSAEVSFRQSNDRLLPKSSAEPFFPPFFACFILKLDRESYSIAICGYRGTASSQG